MRVDKEIIILMMLIFFGCSNEKETPLFRSISSSESGIHFSNDLVFDQEFNIFKYRNFYNGGGVAIADFNNDSLSDIYLISNMSSNRLYQNNGNLNFKDITKTAGVAGTRAWSTGVSVVDIDGDGWLDIYVCNSGDIKGDNKQNELFINNRDGTFSENAAGFGLDDKGFSTHAAFFDYDQDGDVDMYLLNNSYQAIGSFNLMRNERPNRDQVGGDKLYRNEGNQFTDVSEEANIYGSLIGFGLGVTVGDVDRDGWLDIYVSNDFFERDYLYINKRNGTFKEVLEDRIKSTSAASMGADLADLNNDGYPEVFVTDMLPDNNERIKTVTTFDSWDRFQYSLQNGYGHQFTRNTLQLNRGDGSFSEIGRYAGVEASDWSWGALIFDFQNDGFKDIFIANGIYQDLTNQDFLRYITEDKVSKKITSSGKVDYKMLIDYIPSVPISNHAYLNDKNLTFENQSSQLGLAAPSFSSGSAYGDLDNDGDLDLVVNNTNMPFFLYENQSNLIYPDHHYLRFNLQGEGKNTQALGTNITVYEGKNKYYLEHLPTRGFESTVDHRPLFGLGNVIQVDSIRINWPLGKTTLLGTTEVDQDLWISASTAVSKLEKTTKSTPDFVQNPKVLADYKHTENTFVDFDRDRLTFQMISTQGPCLCTADINNDGLDDVYIGGAKDQTGYLALQNLSGTFDRMALDTFAKDKGSEDVDCAFFDANGDGAMDLYVVSGGSDFQLGAPQLGDRLYFSDHDFNFTKAKQILPVNKFESTSVVIPADYDEDGDIDLFVGGRLQSEAYGFPRNGYILNNDGAGNYTNVSNDIAPDLKEIGMITDAKWADIDNDKDLDLIVVGEWMPIAFFINDQGRYNRRDLMPQSNGWWNVLEIEDLNGDGMLDLILGNHGLNSRFKASEERPLHMLVKDFDRNGTIEQIICQFEGDKLFPLSLRHDLSMQIPSIKKKYLKYDSYKDQEITDIFGSKGLNGALDLTASHLASTIFLNKGLMEFEKMDLPDEVQYSCVYTVEVADFNFDGYSDILFGGNLYDVKPEMGQYDASYGTLLIGNGSGQFVIKGQAASGIILDGSVRNLSFIDTKEGKMLLVANNNAQIQAYQPQVQIKKD
jgi:hypothetical protein